ELHEAIEETRGQRYAELLDEVQPFDQAHELIQELKQREATVVLASSSPQDELDHYLDLLDARDLADSWTTKDDVDATKPAPDLVEAALEKAGTREAVMVGDTPWDVQAASKAGVATVCVISGGFSRAELEEAGADAVYVSVEELRGKLDETPLSFA
ncbi:MAG TPA: HAD family hydrolase, partial [Gaiellaceae bacterium]|nr:HAD family hydrolase [Gaiellaceae bacterium]